MRYARNQTLVNVMRDYGYVEALGMGVRNKIIPGMLAHNGTEPEFIVEESRLTVRLWKEPRASVIPKECKRLAEVDFPIAGGAAATRRGRSPSAHGHPSTLHLWWARRPLASCRAVLAGAALARSRATRIVRRGVQGGGAKAVCPPCRTAAPGPTDEELRQALLRFIADFANWDLAAQPNVSGGGARAGARRLRARGRQPLRAAARGGSFRRRRLDSARGAARRLRRLRQRPQSRSPA
ncbi:MAG: DUF1156 domain-containing protein [Burkholderiales bacterium]|nr:DUF1156 domain-containing protein [Burkholderiales bacterium]